jgi:hypothetical protein
MVSVLRTESFEKGAMFVVYLDIPCHLGFAAKILEKALSVIIANCDVIIRNISYLCAISLFDFDDVFLIMNTS